MATEGCEHYRNECEILAPCCSRYFRCHRCHNSEQEDACGPLDRSAIKRIRCAEQSCKLEQDPAAKCAGCGVDFAEHVCLDCSLYRQADPKNGLFHCKDCGICRVGKGLGDGGSHWHCRSCCACLSNNVDREEHLKVCRKDASRGECCICFEDMHESREERIIGHYCGHFIHKSCCDAYFQTGKIECPLCQKPLVNIDGVEERWRINGSMFKVVLVVLAACATMIASRYFIQDGNITAMHFLLGMGMAMVMF